MSRSSGSVRQQVLTSSAVVLLLGAALAGVLYMVALDRILYDIAVEGGYNQARQVAETLSTGQRTPSQAVAEVAAPDSRLQVLTQAGVLADSASHLGDEPMTQTWVAPGRSQATQVLAGPGQPRPYAVVALGFTNPGGAPGVVAVAVDLGVAKATVTASTGLFAAGAIILIGGLMVLVSRLTDRALAPVERIRREVAGIRQLGGVERIWVPDTDDEIARLAETMNEMLRALARSDAAQRRFVSDASHELRSPLATIRTVVETTPQPGDVGELLLAEVVRTQRLVDDLLTLAKADDDGLNLAREEVDVDDLLDQEVRRLRATGAAQISANIAAARVIGDTLRLAQVLRNLVDNAARHARGQVQVASRSEGEHIVVVIDNDSDPIPVDQREAIFDRFARLADSRERDSGGSGLGLAIVKTLVELHGGQVRAGENEQGWCRFEVRLPAAPLDQADDQSHSNADAQIATSAGGAATGPSAGFNLRGRLRRRRSQ